MSWQAIALMRAIEGEAKERNLTEAFQAIVQAYYEEYTDATELDSTTYSALSHIFDICFPFGEDAEGREFEQIVGRPNG